MKKWFLLIFLFAFLPFPAASAEILDDDESVVAAGPAEDAEDGDGEDEQKPLTAEDIPIPLARANVGDWVLYRKAKGGKLRMTVIEKWLEPGDVTLVVELAETARKKKRPQITNDVVSVKEQTTEIRNIGPKDTVVAAEMYVKKRKLRTRIINYIEGGEIVKQSYISDEVPLYGLVRGVTIKGRERTNVLSLEDFGFAEGEE